MRFAQFRITEVRHTVFAIRPVEPDLVPGPQRDTSFVVRVTDIPDGVTSREITDRLTRLDDFNTSPSVISWDELNNRPSPNASGH